MEETSQRGRKLAVGRLTPAIVLYDEEHHFGEEIANLVCADTAKKPDILIVMGTSLKVVGTEALAKAFAKAVHGSVRRPPVGIELPIVLSFITIILTRFSTAPPQGCKLSSCDLRQSHPSTRKTYRHIRLLDQRRYRCMGR